MSTDPEFKIKKTRKKHRNSKHGCTNCKQRQIKCDEYLPICNNCQKRDDACSYLFMHTDEFQRLMRLKHAEENEQSIRNNENLSDPNVEKTTKKKSQFQNPFGVVNTSAGTNSFYDSGFDISEDRTKQQFQDHENFVRNLENLNKQDNTVSKVVDANLIGKSINNYYNYGNRLLTKYESDTPKEEKSSYLNADENTVQYNANQNTLNMEQSYPEINQVEESYKFNDDFNSMFFTNGSEIEPDFTYAAYLQDYPHTEEAACLPDQPYYKFSPSKNLDDPPEMTTVSMANYLGATRFLTHKPPLDPISFFDCVAYKDKLETKDDYQLKRPGFYSGGDSNSSEMFGFVPLHNDSSEKIHNNETSFDNLPKSDCLGNARTVNVKMKLNRTLEIEWFDPLLNKLMQYLDLFQKGNKLDILKRMDKFNIDRFIDKIYRVQINFAVLFSTLMAKSMILFITDVVKNTLFKQKTILPRLNENTRVAICGACEQYSMQLISELTLLIQDKYICRYSEFAEAQQEILLDSFIRIASCTIYHYNSGYRQNISVEQSKECIKYIGTFTAGMYSITISENDKKKSEQIATFRTYSKHLLLWAKNVIVPNYNSEILTEIFNKLSELRLKSTPEFSKKKWSSSYNNLSTFLEKNLQFLKVYRKSNTLLGYDRAFIVRMVSEWYQIFPHDLVNVVQYRVETEDEEILVTLHLTFLALRYYLESLIPGIRSLVKNSFIGGEKMDNYGILNLIGIYKSLKIKKLKLYAIYIIRLTTFFVIRFDRAHSMLSKMYIPEFSSYDGISPEERCQSLAKNWKFGDKFVEIQKAGLDLKHGTFIEPYNYLSLNKVKTEIKRDNAINFKSKVEMICDFENTNTGLFSNDYDPRENVSNKVSDPTLADKNFTNEPVANNSDDEVNGNTMRNCWTIENHIKLCE